MNSRKIYTKLLVSAFFLFNSVFCQAAMSVGDSIKVMETARSFLFARYAASGKSYDHKSASDIDLMQVYRSPDTCRNLLRGYAVENGGYILAVEHNDDVIITGYSLSGVFDPEKANPEFMAFVSAYESSEITKVTGNKYFPAKGSVSPLLDTEGIRWNQSGFYNQLCPPDAETGTRTLVGCVGVAVGQILRYHKYPAVGTGSHSYQHPVYGTLSADFGNTSYNWSNMPGHVTSENNDVAKLLYHVSVSVNTNFGPSASSAYSASVPAALSKHFGFRDAQLIHRDSFTWGTDEFQTVLRNELESNRPFYYELLGNPPHAVVVDGYDGDYFHINFGWGGLDNGNFLLSGVNWAGGYMFGFRGNPILGISPAKLPVNVQDSLALVALFNTAGGSAWINRSNWLTGRLKDWHGVDVVNGRVIHLLLDNNNLSGTIPPEIGNLTALTYLNLSANGLTGSIPQQIGQLNSLYNLTLSFTELSGNIPSQIGNLTRLHTLFLPFNKLTGPVPAALGQMTSLRILSLAGNQLTGQIPEEICNLAGLSSLNLALNQLTGPLPSCIGNLTALTEIDVSENKLGGSLPSSIAGLSSLYLFSINKNEFEGAIPPGIGSFRNLTILNLDNNKFTSLPEEIGQLTNVERFTAVSNRLQGNLPSSAGLMTKIKHLDLSNNLITGIPSTIGNMVNLEYLSLVNNRITSIPGEIGNLKKLYEIYLTSNLLEEIPYEVGTMNRLTILAVDYNRLTSLTFGLSLLRKLSILDLSGNSLHAPLPPLSHIDFYRLDLDKNALTFEDIAASGIASPEPEDCYYWPQAVIRLPADEFYFRENDSVKIDIRDIASLSHPSNVYTWYRNGARLSEGALLKMKFASASGEGFYYCAIDNPLYPYLNLRTDSIRLVSGSGEQASSDTLVSKRGSVLKVADKRIKIVKPSGTRGVLTWQASLDSVQWVSLPAAPSNTAVVENILSVNSDSLVINPKRSTLYRYSIREGECDPVISDTLLVYAFKSELLLDTTLKITSGYADLKTEGIGIIVPDGITDEQFRLTIEKIGTPPPAPDTVTLGNVFDVRMSTGTRFPVPLIIRIRVDSENFIPGNKDRFVPVFYDDSKGEWQPYKRYSMSFADTSIVFETDHLTKLSYWEKSWIDGDYSDKFVRGPVTVYYKSKLTDLMNLYAKNQSPQAWHLPAGDPENGTPLQIQDMAYFANEVMDKFRTLGLEVPDAIALYADQIDDYGMVGLLGMTNGYLTISIYIDDPALLKSVVAHEYMHYTQDYYISAHPGNIFWMEANGHTADRMVWDSTKLSVSESDNYILQNRTGENSIFSFLSRSWDYWDASILTQNLAGNVHYCYLAGTFIHYMRSYRHGEKLKPEILLKETSYTGSWRDYLDNYIKTKLGSTINDEYEDYVKYLVSGRNRNFTLLDKDPGSPADPFRYFNQASSGFARKHLIKLPENEISVPKEDMTITSELEPLSAKMEQFYNLSINRSLCVKYVRHHTDTAGLHVYLCNYDPSSGTMKMTDISRTDSSHFFILAASETNVAEKANQVFLLYINRSGDREITAEYDLEITPVTDFNQLFTFWFGNASGFEAYVHKYTDGTDRRIYFWEQEGSTRTKVYTDSSFTITEIRRDGAMEVVYNFRNGSLSVTENVAGSYEYFDDPDYHTAVYSGSKSIVLKNVFFAPLDEQYVMQGAGVYDFHSTGTEHTRSIIVSITETYHSQCTTCGSGVVLEDYTYTHTDWNADTAIKLHIQVK